MDELITRLDVALQTNHPSLHSSLQPGLDVSSRTSDLRAWFRWRNGQPRDTVETLHGTYRFVSFGDGSAELHHMRSAIWKSPLNAAILGITAPGSFYSIPLLINHAGDGYYFNLFRRSVYYRSKGERDIALKSFASFLVIVIELASRSKMAPGPAAEYEYNLLQRFS